MTGDRIFKEKEMHCYHFAAEISAPIHVVFQCLNKDEHVLKWNTQIIRNIYEGSEEDLEAGSTFTTVQKIGGKVYELEGKYVEYDPPYFAVVETETKEGISKTEYRLEELDGETSFTVDVYLIPSSWIYKTTMKMMKWAVKRMYDEQFERFVDYIHTEM